MNDPPPRRGKREEEAKRADRAALIHASGSSLTAQNQPRHPARPISNQGRLDALQVRRTELEIQHLEVKLGEQRARLIKRLVLLPVWVVIALILTVSLLADPDPTFALVIALVLGGSAGLSSLAGKS